MVRLDTFQDLQRERLVGRYVREVKSLIGSSLFCMGNDDDDKCLNRFQINQAGNFVNKWFGINFIIIRLQIAYTLKR